ncbi:hypothetical protein LEMLEM_LOCUS22059, partial [Lemmus lemmus]
GPHPLEARASHHLKQKERRDLHPGSLALRTALAPKLVYQLLEEKHTQPPSPLPTRGLVPSIFLFADLSNEPILGSEP